MAILWTEEYVIPDDLGMESLTFYWEVQEDKRGAMAVLLEAARERFRDKMRAERGTDPEDGKEVNLADSVETTCNGYQWTMRLAEETLNDQHVVYSALVEAVYDQPALDAAFARLQAANREDRPRSCPTADDVRALQKALGAKGCFHYDIEDSCGEAVFTGDLWIDEALLPAAQREARPAAPPIKAPAVSWP